MDQFHLTINLDPDDVKDRFGAAILLELIACYDLRRHTEQEGDIHDHNGKVVGHWHFANEHAENDE